MPIISFPPILTPEDMQGAVTLLVYTYSRYPDDPVKKQWLYFSLLRKSMEGEPIHLK